MTCWALLEAVLDLTLGVIRQGVAQINFEFISIVACSVVNSLHCSKLLPDLRGSSRYDEFQIFFDFFLNSLFFQFKIFV